MREIYVDKHLNEKATEVLWALSGKINLITAALGSGKTTFVRENLAGGNAIFALPSVQQLLELETTLKENDIPHKRFGAGRSLKEEELGGFSISTHNQLAKISPERARDITLVLDEAHSIITDKNPDFKKDMLSDIYCLIPYFKKVILLTATPQALNVLPIKAQLIKIITENPLDFSNATVLGCLSPLKTAMYRATKEINEKPNSLVVVKHNNTRELNDIRRYILENTELSSEEVIIYTASTRKEKAQEMETTLIDHITKHNRFPESVRVVLTTSAIEEGLNIYSQPSLVLNVREHNPTKISQFIGRFRKGYGKYIVLLKDTKERKEKVPTIEETVLKIEKEIEIFGVKASEMTDKLQQRKYGWDIRQTKYDTKIHGVLRNPYTGKYEVDKCYLVWKNLDEYFRKVSQSPEDFHSLLEKEYGFVNSKFEYSGVLGSYDSTLTKAANLVRMMKEKPELLNDGMERSLDEIYMLFTGENKKILSLYHNLYSKVSHEFIVDLISKDEEKLTHFKKIKSYVHLLTLLKLKEEGCKLSQKENELLKIYSMESLYLEEFKLNFPAHMKEWRSNGTRDSVHSMGMKMKSFLEKYLTIKTGRREEIDGVRRQVKEIIYKPSKDDFHEDISILIEEHKKKIVDSLFPAA